MFILVVIKSDTEEDLDLFASQSSGSEYEAGGQSSERRNKEASVERESEEV